MAIPMHIFPIVEDKHISKPKVASHRGNISTCITANPSLSSNHSGELRTNLLYTGYTRN